jgi:hypothetical protein
MCGPPSDHVHVDLHVTQNQIDRCEEVDVSVPALGTFRVRLPSQLESGMRIRLPDAAGDGRDVFLYVYVDN